MLPIRKLSQPNGYRTTIKVNNSLENRLDGVALHKRRSMSINEGKTQSQMLNEMQILRNQMINWQLHIDQKVT